MKLAGILSLFLSIGASASANLNGEVCKFHVQYDSTDKETIISGEVTAQQSTSRFYDLKVKWSQPKPEEVTLGKALLKTLEGEDYSDALGICKEIAEEYKFDFCDEVKKVTMLATEDVGEDGNDSFILHFRNVNGVVLGRLGKVGWFTSACLPN